jgi:hypothetical protein
MRTLTSIPWVRAVGRAWNVTKFIDAKNNNRPGGPMTMR